MNPFRFRALVVALGIVSPLLAAGSADNATVSAEHSDIGVVDDSRPNAVHTDAPGAQWYPDAGLGLFLHWGIASVRAMNISWPMIPGRALAVKRIADPAERARIIREGDYNLNGRPNSITPDEYWTQAKDFNPQAYDPEKWMAAAAAAGFKYVVLTTRHHEGFALWPSAYGDFDTRNYMGGRDLLKPYVDACRKYGLKVGFYYSPPDWWFDKDYMNFMYGRGASKNPEFPPLGPDLKPRTTTHTSEEIAAHQKAFVELVNGQVRELLTRYGKIDLLWFDGRPNVPRTMECLSLAEIRKLQPDIVVNPRLHGHGDFVTYERKLPDSRPGPGWAEFCNPWTSAWPYVEDPATHKEIEYRAPGFVLGQLAQSRAWGINYLLDLGPKSSGELSDNAYRNLAILADWMKVNGASIFGARALPAGETASVPATGNATARYLFAIPRYRGENGYPEDQLPNRDEVLTLSGGRKPLSVILLTDGKPLDFTFDNGTLAVPVPASRRGKSVDVVKIGLSD